MTTPVAATDSAGDWHALGLRVTFFTDPTAGLPEATWEEFTGRDREVRTEKATERREEGPYHQSRLILIVQPTRIDWHYTAAATLSPQLDRVGEFRTEARRFLEDALRWASQARSAVRLAYGARLAKEADDLRSANRALAPYLPNVRLDDDAEDFLYHINRPRNSRTQPGIRINRLSKWGTLKWQLFLAGGGGVQTATPRDRVASYLELDLSTNVERQELLPDGSSADLLTEMVELGEEIAARGDVR